MHGYIDRLAEVLVSKGLGRAPIVAILGPRQCGKSTLVAHYLSSRGIHSVSLDLQDRTDRGKLQEPELFFERHRNSLVCLDEIQLVPDLFSFLRVEIDRDRRPGRIIILGSASRDLLQQATESLAGRIAFVELTPFLHEEVQAISNWQDHWNRGGFPNSLLARDAEDSYGWREDFVRTFLERDIPALGLAIPLGTMERLWRILTHYHGQTMNYSKAATAANLSIPTLRKYLMILEKTYMVRLVSPWGKNLKKRMVKAPKLYIRDSGLLHVLRQVESFDQLIANPLNGPSWEGFVIENLITMNPRWRPSFIRTTNGAEVDLVLERGDSRIFFECKLTKAPKVSRGFRQLVADLQPDSAWIVSPVEDSYEIEAGIHVGHIHHCRVPPFGTTAP